MSDEQQILEEAMYAAETGNANHWPIVASILADEITRLREQLAEAEGQECVVMLAVNTESGAVDYNYLQYDMRSEQETKTEAMALIDGWEYRPFKVVPLTRPAPAKVPDESELVHIGYTNGAQVLYCVTDESGSFYPDTENDTCIPVYMLRTHAHRLESTTNGAVTLDRIKREWAMLKSHGGE